MANRFSDWITKVGLRSSDVAKALGLPPNAIWKYRRDHWFPTRDVAIRIKRFTGGQVSMDDLLDDATPVEKTKEYRLGLRAIEEAKTRKQNAERKKRLQSGASGRRPNHDQRPE
jgi:plasmid maintenance system antidote protein VapI